MVSDNDNHIDNVLLVAAAANIIRHLCDYYDHRPDDDDGTVEDWARQAAEWLDRPQNKKELDRSGR